MQLNQIIEHIDQAFGEELPFSARELDGQDREVLHRVFGDEGYQSYLQDQVNRQIIRDFLVNAVLLGFLPQQALVDIAGQVGTRESRASLSLHMLMTSVEQAAELFTAAEPDRLSKLKPGLQLPPYIKLIQS